MTDADLDVRRLMDAIWSDGNPWTWSTEGLDDGCFFCGRDDPGLKVKDSVDPTELHEPECDWLYVARERAGYVGSDDA